MLETKTMAFTTAKCGHALGKGVQYLRCLRRGGWHQFKIEIEDPMEKTEQQWLFDGKKEGATLLVGKDFV